MPKIVDHEQQREKFVRAAMALIARDGLEGVTMRAVAAEAGLSYGSLFHYFESKDDLLMHAVRYTTSLQTERVNAHGERYRGLAALERLLVDDVIVDEASRDAWIVWITFLYKAARQQSFAAMNQELIDGWLARIEQALREAREDGEITPGIHPGREAMAVWAFSSGLGQVGLLQPDSLSSTQQKRLIRDYLARLRAP